MSDDVWLLWFEREIDEGEDIELLIGVYTTEEAAKAGVERVKDQPGFKDNPERFKAYRYALDVDSWRSGFITD